MKSRMKTLAASLLLAGAAFAGQAQAASIDFLGAEFELSMVSGFESGHWDVTYTADFTNFTGSQTDITHIAWKFAGLSIESVTPGSATNGLDANGCGSTGANNTWACLDLSPGLDTEGFYSWTFDVVFDGDPSEANLAGLDYSVKARFLPRGLMSCDIDAEGVVGGSEGCAGTTEVPVPGTLGLLGLGLAGLGLVRRRTTA